MSDAAESARIRSLRPPKPRVDPWRPVDALIEEERGAAGETTRSMTVFLAGSECPFTCVYCDLWQHTLDVPTPAGAIPRQLELALDSIEPHRVPDSIKLYNASNFFDSRAVPKRDLDTIASLLTDFRQVTVECHPRLVGESCWRFAEQLTGELEVAMGLETVHPQALPRLNKQMTLEDFESAAMMSAERGIGIRAFVLLSPPFVPADRSVDWTVRSAAYAAEVGAGVVSIIPMRADSGAMRQMADEGGFESPTLEMLERALARSLGIADTVILADLWDVERMSGCEHCRDTRIASLRVMNRTGVAAPVFACEHCSGMDQGGD